MFHVSVDILWFNCNSIFFSSSFFQLFDARKSVLRPDEESLWNSTAAPELMSDEEDDVIDGQPVWVVKTPAERSPALSTLCQELQERRLPGPRSKQRVLQNPEDTVLEDDNGFTLIKL